jgi:hypothetical protein
MLVFLDQNSKLPNPIITIKKKMLITNFYFFTLIFKSLLYLHYKINNLSYEKTNIIIDTSLQHFSIITD